MSWKNDFDWNAQMINKKYNYEWEKYENFYTKKDKSKIKIKPLHKNLIYEKAEPHAKQNIELLIEALYNWYGSLKNKIAAHQYFASFCESIIDMRHIDATDDSERNKILKRRLQEMCKYLDVAMPDDVINKLDSLFWGL